MDDKELIETACKATGLTVDELGARLGYKSLKRVTWGEIPLPESKRKHIADLVRLHELESHASTTNFVVIDGLNRRSVATSPRDKLRETLKAIGLSIPALGKRTGYDAGILENVVNGTGRMSEAMAEKIVAELQGQLTVDDLLEGSDAPRILDPYGVTGTVGANPLVALPGKGKTRIIPLLSWAAAGSLTSAAALDEGYTGEGITSSVPGRAFALEIEGDSMYPEISPGDYAVVRYDQPPHQGQVVIVQTIHGQVYCKRYTTKEGGKLVILSSVNKTYQPMEIPISDIVWIYPVKQVIRNY